jgi:hypothetical protein
MPSPIGSPSPRPVSGYSKPLAAASPAPAPTPAPAPAPGGNDPPRDNFQYFSPILKLWFWTAPIAVVMPPSVKNAVGTPIQHVIDDIREYNDQYRRLPD